MSAHLTSGEIGRCAENAVCSHLIAHGYEIRHRNYAVPRIGELDLVARKGGRLLFIEVKGRTSETFGGAFGSINAGKLNRLRKTALFYLRRFPHQTTEMNEEIIFLAASVLMDDYGTVRKIRLEPLTFA